ncbi:uncharacterized protein ACIB01_007030 [Guaruba guarouba]
MPRTGRKEPGECPEERVTTHGPAARPHRRRSEPTAVPVLGMPRQPRVALPGVGKNRFCFCPLVLSPCCEGPRGSGQKEFPKKLAACKERPERCGAGKGLLQAPNTTVSWAWKFPIQEVKLISQPEGEA